MDIHNIPAKFTADAKIEARLSDGQIMQCETRVEADGIYSYWWEYPSDPQLGSECFEEIDVDDSTATVPYPDEWDFIEEKYEKYLKENPDYMKDVKIVEIIKFLETPDWRVIQESIEDYSHD